MSCDQVRLVGADMPDRDISLTLHQIADVARGDDAHPYARSG
jgi:hypothetical protein